jgi:hypothetical protein
MGDDAMNDAEDLAKKRFMLLNLVRLMGLVLTMGGLANLAGKFLPELAPLFGAFLLVTGAVDFFLVPALLKRAWRTPDA